MTTDLQLVSAFAGVGGFDLAAQRAGIQPVATIEVDPAARGVLHDRFPDVHHFDDIRSVTGDDLRAAGADPRRTVYCAGFPCQDLSVAGRRRGMGQGTRSGLFWEIDRHLAEFAPAWVVLENVPGLLSSTCPCTGYGACQMDDRGPVRGCPGELHTVNGGACVGGCIAAHGGTMGAVLGALGHRGYGFAYRVLDARFFGVPQRRRRVVVVGHLGDDGRAPAQVLAEFEGSLGDSASRPASWSRPAASSGGRAGVAREVVSALTANMAGAGGGVDDNTAQAGHVIGFSHTNGVDEMARAELAPPVMAGHDRMPAVATFRKAQRAHDPEDCERWQEDDVSNTVNTFDIGDTRAAELVVVPITTPDATRTTDDPLSMGEPGDAASAVQTNGTSGVAVLGDVTHTLTAEGHDASEDGTGRGTPIIAATLTAGTSAPGVSAPGRRQEDDHNLVATHSSVRRLTPLECERLQGYPDGHTLTSNEKRQADSARYKQMGNGLAVPVFEWTLRRLVAVHEAVAA